MDVEEGLFTMIPYLRTWIQLVSAAKMVVE
jgi:hypothetical protein